MSQKPVIEFADDDLVVEYESEVREVLEVLGFPEAWVSNESYVSDFDPSEEKLAQASAKLGFPVARNGNSIVSLARRLRDARRFNA